MAPRSKKQKLTASKTPQKTPASPKNILKSAINELSKTPSNTYALNTAKYPELEEFMKDFTGTWADVARAQLEGEVTASMAAKLGLGIRRRNIFHPRISIFYDTDSTEDEERQQKPPARASPRNLVPQCLPDFKICLTKEIPRAHINSSARTVFETLIKR
jgi:hypothetical protein